MSITSYTLMVEDIVKHGERGALLLQHIRYSLNTIRHSGANKKDGLYWFKSPTAFLINQFHWLTEKQINLELRKLVESGVIKREIPKGSGYDRSQWIAMPNEFYYSVKSGKDGPKTEMCTTCGKLHESDVKQPPPLVIPHLPKRENGSDQKGKCPKDLLKDLNNKKGDQLHNVDNLDPEQTETTKKVPKYQKPEQTIHAPVKNMSAPTNNPPIKRGNHATTHRPQPDLNVRQIDPNYRRDQNVDSKGLDQIYQAIGLKRNVSDSKDE